VNIFDAGSQAHLGEFARFTGELEARLFEVVRVKVQVAESMNERARFQIAHLRDHQGEKGVRGNIERDTEKEIGAPLVQLATEFTFLHEELEERVAGRQRHFVDLTHVPGAHDQPTAVRIPFDLGDDIVDLIDRSAIRRAPIAPLRAINTAEISFRVGPFIPDRDSMVVQVFHVRVPAQEPEQLVNDRFEVELFGGEKREALLKRKARLRAENRVCPGTSAVRLELTLFKHKLEQVEILRHVRSIFFTSSSDASSCENGIIRRRTSLCVHIPAFPSLNASTNLSKIAFRMRAGPKIRTISTTLFLAINFLLGMGSARSLAASEGFWAPDFYMPGNDRVIQCLAIAPDHSLYCGGNFFNFADQGVHGIARWDGATWHQLAGGIPLVGDGVRAILPVGNDVYVGGTFNSAGSVAARNLARWDGADWHDVGGGVSGVVRALAWKEGVLYVGGSFTNAGTVTVNNVASWDGTQWKDLDGGVVGSAFAGFANADPVSALHFLGPDLIAAGGFTIAGGSDSFFVARWDGASWHALGDSPTNRLDGGVLSLASDPSGRLYAAGLFSHAGTNSSEMIAAWNGDTWAPLGTGLPRSSVNYLGALYHDGTNLYAGGYVLALERIVRWDGTNWSQTSSPVQYGTSAITGDGAQLFATGILNNPASKGANGIVRFDGTNWSTLGAGMLPYYRGGSFESDAYVYAIMPFQDQIVAAGIFGDEKIAAWDGLRWNSMVGPVRTYDRAPFYALAADGRNLYLSGGFLSIDQKAAVAVARYDGTNWWPMGEGLPRGAYGTCLTVRGSDVFAGHSQGLSRWDGTAWFSTGLTGLVLALALDGETIYAGGVLTNSAGLSLNHITRWDGQTWQPLGEGVDGPVYALTVFNHILYAAGDFGHAGTLPSDHLAIWNGSAWIGVDGSNLGPPGTVATIRALAASPDGTIFAGGAFGGDGLSILQGNFLTPFPKGPQAYHACVGPTVYALNVKGADLFVSGKFRPYGRDNASARFGQWHIEDPLLCTSATAPSAATNGTLLTYSISLLNPTTSPASNCTFTASIPSGTSFVSVDNNGQLAGQKASWSLSNMPPGQQQTLSLTVLVNSPRLFIAFDDYSITDTTARIYRGASIFTSVIPGPTPPTLSLTAFVPEGNFNTVALQIQLADTDSSRQVHIQSSQDLLTWQDLTATQATNSVLNFSDSSAMTDWRFYRAVLMP
jgi:uncharacterized repeat protein (TIGR01451 family)